MLRKGSDMAPQHPDFSPADSTQPLPSRRDRSRSVSAARKARQRARLRASGKARLEVALAASLAADLDLIGGLTGEGTKGEAERILSQAAPLYRDQFMALARRAGLAWRQAQPLLRFAAHLSQPGATFRVGAKVYSHSDWKPVYDELTTLYDHFASSRHWDRPKIEAFFRRASRHFKTVDCLHIAP